MQPIHHAGQQFRTRLGGKAIRPHGGGLHVRDRSPGKVVSRGTCSACLCLCACPARATCCLLPVKLFFFLFPPSSEVSCAVKKKKKHFLLPMWIPNLTLVAASASVGTRGCCSGQVMSSRPCRLTFTWWGCYGVSCLLYTSPSPRDTW